MAKLNLVFGTLALVFASVLVVPVTAQAEGTAVTCKDGSTGKAGKGACSHHGGVDKGAASATTSEPAAAEAPASKSDAVMCKDGSTGKTGKGACSHHGGVDKSGGASSAAPSSMDATEKAPAKSHAAHTESASTASDAADSSGATAKCKDGTYSHSKKHSGSCSHHGGVDQFLK